MSMIEVGCEHSLLGESDDNRSARQSLAEMGEQQVADIEEGVDDHLGIESSALMTSAAQARYGLRARSMRQRERSETESRKIPNKCRQRRPKNKPAQLSKYRRKTANARERQRMSDINAAFNMLGQCVPRLAAQSIGNEKVTKITILKLAMDYISSLSQILEDDGLGGGNLCQNASSTLNSPASSAFSSSSSFAEPPSNLVNISDLTDHLDNLHDLVDFQLPGSLDVLLDVRSTSVGIDLGIDDYNDLPCS